MKWVFASLVLQVAAFIVVRRLFPAGIVFYQGVAVAAAAALLQYVALSRLQQPEPLLQAALAFFMGYSFFFTVPTTVDRAYSVKFLRTLHDQGRMDARQIEVWFAQDFTHGGAVEKRLHEQMATCTIRVEDGKYALTPWGVFLARTFGAACRLFNCPDRHASATKD